MILPVTGTALIMVAVTVPQGTTLTALARTVGTAVIPRHTLQPHATVHEILPYGDKLARRPHAAAALEHLLLLQCHKKNNEHRKSIQ